MKYYCEPKRLIGRFSLIIIAGSIRSSFLNNKLKFTISNLPQEYRILLKDDQSDEIISSSNDVQCNFSWGSFETDGIIIDNINNFSQITIQFLESNIIDNICIITKNGNKILSFPSNITLMKKDDLIYINSELNDYFYLKMNPLDFYNYSDNTSHSYFQINTGKAVVIIPYFQLNKNITQTRNGEKKLEVCPEIKPIIPISDTTTLIANRCEILPFMEPKCNPCLRKMDECSTTLKNNFYQYYGTFPLWWINKNEKTFQSCEDGIDICQPVCDTTSSYYDKRKFPVYIEVINGSGEDILYLEPPKKNITIKDNIIEYYDYNQKINIRLFPKIGYYISDVFGYDKYDDDMGIYLNVTKAEKVKFFMKRNYINLQIVIIDNGSVVSLSKEYSQINCSSTNTYNVYTYSKIFLQAIPDVGKKISSIIGASSIEDDKFLVIMSNIDKQIIVSFTDLIFYLNIFVNSGGYVNIYVDNNILVCNKQCSYNYRYNTKIKLKVVITAEKTTFLGWSGTNIESYNENPEIEFNILENYILYCNFIKWLTLKIMNIKSNGIQYAYIAVNGQLYFQDYIHDYPYKGSINIQIYPNDGYLFVGASDESGEILYKTDSFNIVIKQDLNLVCKYIENLNTITLKIIINGTGSVHINSFFKNETIYNTFEHSFNYDRNIVLDVIDGNFISWTGSINSSQRSLNFRIINNMVLTANFS